MTADAKFEAQTEGAVNKAKRITGQILRIFKSRDKDVMLPLFKALIIPVLEYCSVLTSPIRKEDINKIENVQRYYTAQIRGMEALDYWDRLKALSLYSLKRRRERYCIIRVYTWKIIEGLVPNLDSEPIEEQDPKTGRRGRTLKSRR